MGAVMSWFTPKIIEHDGYDTVTLYALNKATYDLIERVHTTQRPLLVTRENHKKVLIIALEDGSVSQDTPKQEEPGD